MPSPLVSVRNSLRYRTGRGRHRNSSYPITHRSHLQKVALAGADLLDDRAHAVAGYVHHQTLHRLAHFAVNLLVEHAGGETWNS